jgi:hypothetical protein
LPHLQGKDVEQCGSSADLRPVVSSLQAGRVTQCTVICVTLGLPGMSFVSSTFSTPLRYVARDSASFTAAGSGTVRKKLP